MGGGAAGFTGIVELVFLWEVTPLPRDLFEAIVPDPPFDLACHRVNLAYDISLHAIKHAPVYNDPGGV